MNESEFDPARLDVERFAKAAARLEGAWPVARFGRLADSLALPGGELVWQVQGESRARRGAEPQVWLHLKATAQLALECQRCLRPVDLTLNVERDFLFVHGEDTAAQIDADSEDDVLELKRWIDLRELVEDELLLALPLVPRHEHCPIPLLPPADDLDAASEAKPNPFAVLRSLKGGGSN